MAMHLYHTLAALPITSWTRGATARNTRTVGEGVPISAAGLLVIMTRQDRQCAKGHKGGRDPRNDRKRGDHSDPGK